MPQPPSKATESIEHLQANAKDWKDLSFYTGLPSYRRNQGLRNKNNSLTKTSSIKTLNAVQIQTETKPSGVYSNDLVQPFNTLTDLAQRSVQEGLSNIAVDVTDKEPINCEADLEKVLRLLNNPDQSLRILNYCVKLHSVIDCLRKENRSLKQATEIGKSSTGHSDKKTANNTDKGSDELTTRQMIDNL